MVAFGKSLSAPSCLQHNANEPLETKPFTQKRTTDDQQLRAKPTELITDISMQRIIFTSFSLSNNKVDLS